METASLVSILFPILDNSDGSSVDFAKYDSFFSNDVITLVMNLFP